MNRRALKFLRKLNWPLATHLSSPRGSRSGLYNLSYELNKFGISVDEYRKFKNARWDDSSSTLPKWALVHLVSLRTRTPDQAILKVAEPSEGYGDTALLIMVAVTLARFGLLLPLRQVVQKFIILEPSSEHSNIMLQALSTLRTSSLTSEDMVGDLIAYMKEQDFALQEGTINSLLVPRFTTPGIIQSLRVGVELSELSTSSLYCLLRAYFRLSDRVGFEQAFEALRGRTGTVSPLVPGLQEGSPQPANTWKTASHPTAASAFDYLSSLASSSSAAQPLASSSKKPTQPLPHKTSIDIHDWTSALHIAVRDLSVSVRDFVRMFNRHKHLGSGTEFMPSTATYTVLIRGLIIRQVPRLAIKYWRRLLQSGLAIDGRALTAGIQALVYAGETHTAITTLEAFCSRADTVGLPAPQWTIGRSPVLLDVIAMNEIMVAFMRMNRPDVVFKLWDYMSPLYGVLPNHATLDIILRAARLSARMDDSVKGNFHLAMYTLRHANPFRSKDYDSPVIRTRADAIKDLKSLVEDPQVGVKEYKVSIWDGKRASDTARHLFLKILVKNFPALLDVPCPLGYSQDILLDATQQETTPTPHPPQLASSYLQLIPTDSTFLSYLHFLAVAPSPAGQPSFETEVPVTLAWMKALAIKPSRGTLATALAMFMEAEGRGSPMWNSTSQSTHSSSPTPEPSSTNSTSSSQPSSSPPPLPPASSQDTSTPTPSWLTTLRQRTAQTSSPYELLVDFIRDWVGPKNVPNQHDMRQWRLVLEKVRERNRRREGGGVPRRVEKVRSKPRK